MFQKKGYFGVVQHLGFKIGLIWISLKVWFQTKGPFGFVKENIDLWAWFSFDQQPVKSVANFVKSVKKTKKWKKTKKKKIYIYMLLEEDAICLVSVQCDTISAAP